mgnify:CR=1 FL=1
MDNIDLKITKHAEQKISQREISVDTIKKVIKNPDIKKVDKFDDSLLHYIKDSGIVVDYDKDNKIVSLEVTSFSKRVGKEKIIDSITV